MCYKEGVSAMARAHSADPIAPARMKKSRKRGRPPAAAHVEEAFATARQRGLLGGPKTRVIRARTSAALVDEAKRRTGIQSDTELIEAALASLAAHDDFAEWLIANRGTVDPSLDLEF
jgi:hypothetical protein